MLEYKQKQKRADRFRGERDTMAILSVQIDSVINMVRDDVRLLKTISSLAMFEWIFLEIE